jgi:hypothetical protein
MIELPHKRGRQPLSVLIMAQIISASARRCGCSMAAMNLLTLALLA